VHFIICSESFVFLSVYLKGLRLKCKTEVIVKLFYVLGFEVFTAASTKMAVFWVLASCSLVEV
jgi:hypothetical protein